MPTHQGDFDRADFPRPDPPLDVRDTAEWVVDLTTRRVIRRPQDATTVGGNQLTTRQV